MEPTDNHELQIWEHGDRPWSHNEDMEYIEQRLVVRDSEANRSDYTPHDRAAFIATDTGAVYDGDGSSWNIATRGVGHLRLQSDDAASRVYYDEDGSGQPVHFQREASSSETALTFSGTNVGIGSATDPSSDLEVGGDVEVDRRTDIHGQLHVEGLVNCQNRVDVAGQLHVGGLVNCQSDLEVAGITTIESTTTVNGKLNSSSSEVENNLLVGGDLNVQGSKNFVHKTGDGSEIVYTSQESAAVRAVYEDQAAVSGTGETEITLPDHFTTVVSDEAPQLRVQVTPHDLATVAVTERTPSELTIESSDDVSIDYRVTGVRDGFEDTEVVRKPVDN